MYACHFNIVLWNAGYQSAMVVSKTELQIELATFSTDTIFTWKNGQTDYSCLDIWYFLENELNEFVTSTKKCTAFVASDAFSNFKKKSESWKTFVKP